MTKSEQREVNKVNLFLQHGMKDTAARSLSALIRGAMTNKSERELRQIAVDLKLTQEPEFIC
jgi:hypothetical protein